MTGRSRRRRGRFVAVLMVVFLLGGSVLVDRVAHSFAQTMAADAVRAKVGATDLDVTVSGFPFLTQVIGGKLEDVHAHASSVTWNGLSLTDVDLTATGVSIRDPRGADRVVAGGTLSTAVVQDQIRAVSGLDLLLSVEGDVLVATGTAAGVPIAISFAVHPAGTEGLSTSILGAQIAGVDADVSAVDGVLTTSIAQLDLAGQLPAGAQITDAVITSTGITLTVTLDDVTLDSL
ncbi:DUF2993 domain-containing protein [Cellulosimicrobium cellulans]|uniref:LmeA family phospholipid-binding protein n=1 Tax=Cellulosimicrobium cellulans TaxID=1710 RepID=UPI0016522BEA|nr:DUF2993 domain-containing protein [Cellulosimicrobium cellulans]